MTINSVPVSPSLLASDGVTIYWTDDAARTIDSMPVAGGAVATLATGIQAQSLAVEDANVYYFVLNDGLYAIAKDGGPSRRISDQDVRRQVVAATVRNGTAFWSSDNGIRALVKSSPVDGGELWVVATMGGSPAHQISVTKSAIFFGGGLGLYEDPLDGGFPLDADFSGMPEPMRLGEASRCDELLTDDDAAYCYTMGASLTRTSAVDLTTIVLAAPSSSGGILGHVGRMTLDATYLYFTNGSDRGTDSVMRIPKQGGTATVIASEGGGAMATDDAAVYWASTSGIRRWLK